MAHLLSGPLEQALGIHDVRAAPESEVHRILEGLEVADRPHGLIDRLGPFDRLLCFWGSLKHDLADPNGDIGLPAVKLLDVLVNGLLCHQPLLLLRLTRSNTCRLDVSVRIGAGPVVINHGYLGGQVW